MSEKENIINLNEVFIDYPQLLEKFKPQLKRNLISFLALEVLREKISTEEIAEAVADLMKDKIAEEITSIIKNHIEGDIDLDDIAEDIISDFDVKEKAEELIARDVEALDIEMLVEDHIDYDTVREAVGTFIQDKLEKAF